MPRIGVTSFIFNLLPHLKGELLAQYSDAKFNPGELRPSEEWLIDFLRDCDVAVVGIDKFTERVISSLPRLKVIACCSVGVDHLDPAILKRHGIRLGWIAGVNKVSVAELTVSLMINLLRKIHSFNLGLREGNWPTSRMGLHLRERTVGIHGCGNVGKELVRLLQPFGVRLIACDRVNYADFYREFGVSPVSPEELWEQSEILTIHLPKNSSTMGMYTSAVLDRLRPGCFLVNTARGGIVDEAALKERLADGRIAAAAFDVFLPEPPVSEIQAALMKLPNFLGTPHIGGSAREAWEAMGRAGMRGIAENFLPEPGVYPFD